MRKTLNVALVGILVLGLLACEQRTDRVDSGGVIITFGQLNWQAIYSLSATAALGAASIETITLVSIAKNPDAVTSALMDIEMRSAEITFRRADTGTRVPPTLVFALSGALPINGDLTITGMPFMLDDQLLNPPMSDLLAINGGIDSETGSASILLDVSIVFFGRTLSGDAIQSAPLRQTIQFGR